MVRHKVTLSTSITQAAREESHRCGMLPLVLAATVSVLPRLRVQLTDGLSRINETPTPTSPQRPTVSPAMHSPPGDDIFRLYFRGSWPTPHQRLPPPRKTAPQQPRQRKRRSVMLWRIKLARLVLTRRAQSFWLGPFAGLPRGPRLRRQFVPAVNGTWSRSMVASVDGAMTSLR
jgi:hypothetical protein